MNLLRNECGAEQTAPLWIAQPFKGIEKGRLSANPLLVRPLPTAWVRWNRPHEQPCLFFGDLFRIKKVQSPTVGEWVIAALKWIAGATVWMCIGGFDMDIPTITHSFKYLDQCIDVIITELQTGQWAGNFVIRVSIRMTGIQVAPRRANDIKSFADIRDARLAGIELGKRLIMRSSSRPAGGKQFRQNNY